MSCCTAMMSARGTMTSPTRRSRRPRMFLSMVLSSGEKPVSPGAHASSTSLRSARIEPGFQPNSARSARANQLSPPSRGRVGRGTGRLRGSYGAPARLDWMDRCQAWRSGVAKSRGDRDRACQAAPGSRSRAFPCPRPRHRPRDRSRPDEEIHAPRDARDDARRACPSSSRFAFASSRRRSRCRRAGARLRRRCAGRPETTARWSACPCRASRD